MQSGRHALVEFIVVFSRPVPEGQTIIITGHPYKFILKGFQISSTRGMDFTSHVDAGVARLRIAEPLPTQVTLCFHSSVRVAVSLASN